MTQAAHVAPAFRFAPVCHAVCFLLRLRFVRCQESKFVINAKSSPFIPGSSAPDFIRQKIVGVVDDEFARMAKIIADPSNPLRDVEVIVSDPAANPFFIDLMKKHGLNGRIINR